MKTRYNIQILFFTTLLICSNINAQDSLIVFEYPRMDKIDVIINCDIYFSKNKYLFEYNLISDNISEQNVWDWFLNLGNKIDSIQTPSGWNALYINSKNKISWAAIDSLKEINPGNSLSGFSYISSGMPTIVKAYIRGWVDIPIVDEAPDSIIGGNILENSKKVFTIGPMNPPSEFSIRFLLDKLTGYAEKSFELNWIKSREIKDKYSEYLSFADSLLIQEKNTQAREQLFKLISDIEIDSLEFLTNESYALLKYNTEYLLERIPEDKPQDIRSLIEQLKVYNDECKTKGWYTVDWAHNVQKIAIDNGIMMLDLNVPASTLIIMEQFNITMDYYKNAGFLKQEGFDLLRPQNDLLITELKKVTSGEQ